MSRLEQWVDVIMYLSVLGSILLYILDWNATFTYGLENCPAKLPQNAHNIFGKSTKRFIYLFNTHCLPYPLWVHVGNGVFILLFGHQPNRGHSYQIKRTVDVDPPFLTGLVPSQLLRIGTEYLGGSVFEGKGNKEGQKKVNICASKMFLNSK